MFRRFSGGDSAWHSTECCQAVWRPGPYADLVEPALPGKVASALIYSGTAVSLIAVAYRRVISRRDEPRALIRWWPYATITATLQPPHTEIRSIFCFDCGEQAALASAFPAAFNRLENNDQGAEQKGHSEEQISQI
jgi:hypothetical protein